MTAGGAMAADDTMTVRTEEAEALRTVEVMEVGMAGQIVRMRRLQWTARVVAE